MLWGLTQVTRGLFALGTVLSGYDEHLSFCGSVGWLVVPALVGVLRTLRVGSVWSEPLASGDSRTVYRSKSLPSRFAPNPVSLKWDVG